MSTRIKFKDGGCRHIEFRKDVAISLLLNRFSPNMLLISNTGLMVEKTANINVTNYITSKLGVYRPDCTYKLLQLFTKNIHTKPKWIVEVSKVKKCLPFLYQLACILYYQHV